MPKRTKIAGWRKIAAAAWGPPHDPQVYGDLDVDATAALAFADDVRRATGVRVTMTALAGKAVAHALARNPDLNVRLHRGHFVQRDGVDVFFIVSAEDGAELSGVKVVNTDGKGAAEVAAELDERARRIRTGDDVELGRTKRMLARTPVRLLGPAIRAAAWLTTDRGVDLPNAGLPRDAFGSAIVSSVGMFGIAHAYAPLATHYRVPFLVLVGEVAPRPVVVDGNVTARPMVTLSATLDHRYVDGFHAARLARSAREYLADPRAFEPS